MNSKYSAFKCCSKLNGTDPLLYGLASSNAASGYDLCSTTTACWYESGVYLMPELRR